MTYKEADKLLQGRCRNRRKLENNTYLERRSQNTVAVRLHSTDVVTLHRDGSFQLDSGGWNTITTRDRINRYLPRYHVSSERGVLFLVRTLRHYRWHADQYEPGRYKRYVFQDGIRVAKTGAVNGAGDMAAVLQQWRDTDRERRRLRYWVRMGRMRPGRPPRDLTLSKIMEEPNVSIRLGMMHCYGLDRFLLESGASVIDTQAGYELLALNIDSWRRVLALKMRCPSTDAVYINPVPPHIRTAAEATDWMFDTTDYLGHVSQQS